VEIIDCESAKFDLTFTISTGSAGWTQEIEYDSDLFDHGTIERWLCNFEVLLKDIAENPQQQLRELRMQTEAERNETPRAVPEPTQNSRRTWTPGRV
jgi:non-ribosomal peptide synthetase component F